MATSAFPRLRPLRLSLGLSTSDLAQRLNVCQSSIVRLEQSEERGAITLASLAKAAQALGAELVYALQPKQIGDVEGQEAEHSPSSGISGELREEMVRRKLSTAERLSEACELSDLARRLCSKKLSNPR